MTDRHLLPDEIDQLLDGETGFGIAPLESHARECAQCRAQIEAGRQLVDAIEHLPRLAPSPLFAEHVMAQVHVYEPWDVAVRDAATTWISRLVPRSRPLRVLAGAFGLAIASAGTLACIWLGAHLDAVFFFTSIARTRLRDVLLEQLGLVLSTVFGSRAVDVLGAGNPVLLIGIVAAFVVLVTLTAFAVRSVVSTSRRGRA